MGIKTNLYLSSYLNIVQVFIQIVVTCNWQYLAFINKISSFILTSIFNLKQFRILLFANFASCTAQKVMRQIFTSLRVTARQAQSWLCSPKVYILREVMHSKDYWNLQVRVSGKYVKL